MAGVLAQGVYIADRTSHTLIPVKKLEDHSRIGIDPALITAGELSVI